jgi:exopolysaccharide production protein ExoZ
MFLGVQALRFVAATAVVGVHAFHPYFEYGFFGVDVFFVISGFVMVISSDHLFGKPKAAVQFGYRRFIRIVPLYWTVTATVLLCDPNYTALRIAQSFLFLPKIPIVQVGWTLIFEVYFYILFALCLRFSRIVAVSWATAVLVLLVDIGYAFDLWGTKPFFWLTNPLFVEFAAGMWLACAYLRGARLPIPAAILVAALGISAAFVYQPQLNDLLSRAAIWGSCALLVVAGATLGARVSDSPRLKRISMLAGDTSYAIYLVHWPLIGPMTRYGAPPALTFTSLVLIGIAVHLFLEKPLMLMLRSKIRAPLQDEIVLQKPIP